MHKKYTLQTVSEQYNVFQRYIGNYKQKPKHIKYMIENKNKKDQSTTINPKNCKICLEMKMCIISFLDQRELLNELRSKCRHEKKCYFLT